MIIKTPWLPRWIDGIAFKWFIIVRFGCDYIIPHEMVHIVQQKKYGLVYFYCKYLSDKNFRYAMEFDAYLNGSKFSIEEARKMANKYV